MSTLRPISRKSRAPNGVGNRPIGLRMRPEERLPVTTIAEEQQMSESRVARACVLYVMTLTNAREIVANHG